MSNSTGAFARAVPAVELLAVLLAAPALLFPSPVRLIVALIVPIVWLCQWRIGSRLLPPTPLNASVFILLGMVAVSLAVTFDLNASLGNASGVLLGAMAFWACARWVNTPDRLRTATVVFIAAGCALAFIGLRRTMSLDSFRAIGSVAARSSRTVRRVSGGDQELVSTAIAGCLVLLIPLQFALLAASLTRRLTEWRTTRCGWLWSPPAQGLLLLLTAGTLLLMRSRSAWGGLLVAFFAFLAGHNRHTRALVFVAIVALIVAATVTGPERVLDLSISESRGQTAVSVRRHVEIWSRAIYAIQDFPLTGMGMNTFGKVLPVFYPAIPMAPAVDVADAHNHLLQVAVDLGVPGLVAYLSIWLTAAALLVSVYCRWHLGVYRVLANGLGAGLLANFTSGMTDAIPLGAKVGLLFWLTLALVVALHHVSLSEASRHALSRDATT